MKKENNCRSINDLINVSFSMHGLPVRWTIQPAQVKEEITCLLRLLARQKLETILEIGTSYGGTLFLFTRISRPNALIISVNLPYDSFGRGYPEWRSILYKSFPSHKQKVFLVCEDSHRPSTLKTVKAILGERKVDFLFIDGDHTYEGVKRDFEMYSELVGKYGVIAIHDICFHTTTYARETGFGVDRFWREIREHFPYDELIEDEKQGWAGIGILYQKV
jgi:predicted O-methyltransferase YrrM